jgi:outer membrane protein assembly factor BamB
VRASTRGGILGLAVLVAAPLASGGPGAPSTDWPRWLGPDQNGSTSGGGALGRPGLRLRKAWTHPIGGGRSGLAIAGGILYTLTTDGERQHAIALRTADGKPAWSVPLGPHTEDGQLPPVSTPAVAGNLVFALGSDCILRALAADSGQARWQADLKQRFGAAPRRGCESSPFVEGGRLVLQPAGADDHRLVALDAGTGELAWTAKGRERANYSSPVAADIGGVRQVVVHHIATVENGQMSGLTGFRLADGALLWSATFERHLSVETPLVAPEGVLLLTWNDARLARVSRSGDAWTAQTVWNNDAFKSRTSPPVYRDGHLYGFREDDLVCVRAGSGEVAWRERVYPGSLILVDGQLVVLSASAGLVRVVEATPEGYRERGRLEVLNRGAQTETPPSFAGGTIFVRNDEEVAAVVVEP